MKKLIAFILAVGFISYGCEDKDSPKETTGEMNGYTWVDLGLPSGTKWATCNVGAENPEDSGFYYAWGETMPKGEYSWRVYSFEKNNYSQGTVPEEGGDKSYATVEMFCVHDPNGDPNLNLDNYENWGDLYTRYGFSPYFNNEIRYTLSASAYDNFIRFFKGTSYNESSIAKYNNIDDIVTLESSEDVATANWGDKWRMPTKDEMEELKNKCKWDWISVNDKSGYKITGPNGNSIFLPAVGYCYEDRWVDAVWSIGGTAGFYWTSSLDSDHTYDAYLLYFSEYGSEISSNLRYCGQPVRPVCVNTSQDETSASVKGNCNGHNWMDLALPSGTKWATCNVGANSPETYGNTLPWNETVSNNIHDYGTDRNIDSLSMLSNANVAVNSWGEKWRMPTRKEFEELISECVWKWTYYNGEKGYLVIGSNGGYIFLPTKNCNINEKPRPEEYWSGSIDAGISDFVSYLRFDSKGYEMYSDLRNSCKLVRPVWSESVDSFDIETTIGKHNGHEYVDLGLPSGLLWATYNIGASSPNDKGDYFAWGAKQKMKLKPKVSHNRSYGIYNSRTIKSPCTSCSENPSTLPAYLDVANIVWGKGWRMPTKEDFEELLKYSKVKGISDGEYSGMLVTGPNGSSIFLPGAGYCKWEYNKEYDWELDLEYKYSADYEDYEERSQVEEDGRGNYWSSSLSDSNDPWCLSFGYDSWSFLFAFANYPHYIIQHYRCYGLSIRPVCTK